MTLLTMWGVQDATQQRTAVAGLNAGFTLGAVLAPAIAAISLARGGSCYPCFLVAAAVSAASAVKMATSKSTRAASRCVPAATSMQAKATTARQTLPTDTATASPPYTRRVIGCLALVLFCVTGCEHAIGTWLPVFGHEAGVARSPMALMAGDWVLNPQPLEPSTLVQL